MEESCSYCAYYWSEHKQNELNNYVDKANRILQSMEKKPLSQFYPVEFARFKEKSQHLKDVILLENIPIKL